MAADFVGMVTGGLGKEMGIGWGVICEGVMFEVSPERLNGVQFRGIGRKEIYIQFTSALEKFVNIFSAVREESIPEDEQRFLDMGSECLEEAHDVRAGDIGIGVEGKVKSYALADRSKGQSSNHGYLVVRTGLLVEDRRLPLRRPSAPEQGGQKYPALVNKDKMRSQCAGFFLMRGHSTLIQRRMAFSSRSRARRSGLWGLHPSERNNRGTYRG